MRILGKIESPVPRLIQFTKNPVHLSGWCLDPATGAAADRVFVRIGKRTVECERVERPDIVLQTRRMVAKSGAKVPVAIAPCPGFEAVFKIGKGLKCLGVYASYQGRVTRIASLLVYRYATDAISAIPASALYQNWIERYDTPGTAELTAMRRSIDEFAQRPLISIVMPVFNPPERFLREAIESVRHQVYTHWELCIADDASGLSHVREVLAEYEALDPRIKVVHRPENGHISEASNSALAVASGEWVALLDHDDLLPLHALYWLAERIQRQPGLQMIYSDEDKIDDVLQARQGPYFKTDWNVDLFYSQNMFSHLGAYRTDLLRKIGGFRKGYEGAQDYDLALRCIEVVAPEAIAHIPRVLYHWRVHPASTSSGNEAKPYVMNAGERALNAHLARTAPGASATWLGYGYRVRYPTPERAPLVSLILPIVDWHGESERRLKDLLEKADYPQVSVMLLDLRAEAHPPLAELNLLRTACGSLSIERSTQPGDRYRSINAAAAQASGTLLCLLEPDCEVIGSGWLRELVSHAVRPGVGCVGARLWYPDHTLCHAGTVLGLGPERCAGQPHQGSPKGDNGYFGRLALCSAYSAVSEACLLVRSSIFHEVGGFDESGRAGSFTDVDFCLKVRAAGYRNLVTPYADLSQHGGYKLAAPSASAVDFLREHWGDALPNDPFYNPNLSLRSPHFELAFPPRHTAAHGFADPATESPPPSRSDL